MAFDTAHFQWQEGERRLREADPAVRPALERARDRVVEELRRRLGGAFTTAELVALYDRGTEWCLPVAMASAPEQPEAWDEGTVSDAAFARYVREAVDFAGGRRIEAAEPPRD